MRFREHLQPSTRTCGCTTRTRAGPGRTCRSSTPPPPRSGARSSSTRAASTSTTRTPTSRTPTSARSSAGSGYRIRVLPDLEVEHVKGYDLAGSAAGRLPALRGAGAPQAPQARRHDRAQNDTSVPVELHAERSAVGSADAAPDRRQSPSAEHGAFAGDFSRFCRHYRAKRPRFFGSSASHGGVGPWALRHRSYSSSNCSPLASAASSVSRPSSAGRKY